MKIFFVIALVMISARAFAQSLGQLGPPPSSTIGPTIEGTMETTPGPMWTPSAPLWVPPSPTGLPSPPSESPTPFYFGSPVTPLSTPSRGGHGHGPPTARPSRTPSASVSPTPAPFPGWN